MSDIDYLLGRVTKTQAKATRIFFEDVHQEEISKAVQKRNDAVAAVLKYVTELETMFDALAAKQEEIDALQDRVAELRTERDELIEQLR